MYFEKEHLMLLCFIFGKQVLFEIQTTGSVRLSKMCQKLVVLGHITECPWGEILPEFISKRIGVLWGFVCKSTSGM